MVCLQTKNTNLGKCLRALHKLENVDIFYGHLEYFMLNWDILLPFGSLCVHLVHFPVLGIMHQKNLATLILSGPGLPDGLFSNQKSKFG
jgi:hypothetical protein